MGTTPTPDQELDARIEKRVALLRDSIELALTKQFYTTLNERFNSAGKLLGYAFGIVSIIVAAFGIKTFIDLKEAARTTAIDEVKKTLSIDDPNSDFRRDIDKVVARGLIDSYLLTIAKGKGERFRSDISISEADLRRLQFLIMDPKTTDKDFSDAVEVLLSSTIRARDDSLMRTVLEIARGTDEKYRWIKNQPEKRAALLRLYTGNDLASVSSSVLSDQTSSKTLLLAAIKYSGRTDPQSGKLLEPLTSNSDPDISSQAALALARVSPNSAAVKAVLDKPLKTNSIEDWTAAIRVAIEVAKPKGPFDDDSDLAVRNTIAATTLQNAIDQGFFFRLSSRVGDSSMVDVYTSRSNSSTSYGISNEFIRGGSQGVVTLLMQRASHRPQGWLKVVRAFCLADYGRRCWGVMRLNLEDGGLVMLQGGARIDRTAAPGGVTLRADDVKPDSRVSVTWTDKNAASKRGVLAKLAGVEHMAFSVGVTKSLAQGDEDQ